MRLDTAPSLIVRGGGASQAGYELRDSQDFVKADGIDCFLIHCEAGLGGGLRFRFVTRRKLEISPANFSSPSLEESDNSTSRGKEAGYFFNSAGQFCTSVRGSVPSFRFPLLMRNFFPSAVTS